MCGIGESRQVEERAGLSRTNGHGRKDEARTCLYASTIKAQHPQLAILVGSMHVEAIYAERMLRAGASGYITKRQPPKELVKAIREVLDNHVYLSKEASEKLLHRFTGKPQPNQSPVELLTDRDLKSLS